MRKLVELTQSFETSIPVFRLQNDSDRSRVSIHAESPISKFKPKDSEDPLQVLVNQSYREYFEIGRGSFKINRNEMAELAGSKIRHSLGLFIVNNSKMQKPQQSKLFKWVQNDWPRSEYFDGIAISMYKYLHSFCGSNMRMHGDNQKHVDNAMALFEATMEKYSRE